MNTEPETQEDLARRNYEMRVRALGDGITRTLDASGCPPTLAVEALSFSTSVFLTHLAQRDKKIAAALADNLANSLLALCAELDIAPGASPPDTTN